jgi:hypothetical protein
VLTAYSEKQSCTFLICHKCVAQLVTVFFPYPCQKCLHHGVIFYFSCIMNVNTDGWASTVYAACRERTDCVGIQYCNTQSTCKPLFLSKYTYRVLHTHTHTHPPTPTHTHTHRYNDNGIQINPAGLCSTHTDVVISAAETEVGVPTSQRCNQVCMECLHTCMLLVKGNSKTYTHIYTHTPDMQA